jgi:hypothetical protein
MEECIELAESAMHARLDDLSLNHGGPLGEYRAITNALNGLDILHSSEALWNAFFSVL